MKNLPKQLLIGTFLLLTVVACSKKDDDGSNGPGEKKTDVYTAGYVEVPTGPTINHVATLWKNGVAQTLSQPGRQGAAYKVVVSGNDVYVAGRELEGSKSVARLWKNGVASSPINSTRHTEATTLAVSAGGDVYIIIREWDNTGSEYKLLKNGTVMSLSPASNYSVNELLDVFVSGDDVYLAGSSKPSGFNLVQATIWKNGSPDFLQAIVPPHQNTATRVFVSGNDVYVLGTENYLSQRGIVLWKNGTPTRITEDSQDARSNSLFVSGSDVYISGDRQHETTFNVVGTVWKNGIPVFTSNDTQLSITSIFVLNNNLYVCGTSQLDYSLGQLWKNSVPEHPAIDKASIYSVFVAEN